MSLTTHTITGNLRDLSSLVGMAGVIGANATVTVIAETSSGAITDGATGYLGREISIDVPDGGTMAPITVSEGLWRFAFHTSEKINGRHRFPRTVIVANITSDTTWGAIIEQGTTDVDYTPSSLQQALTYRNAASGFATAASGSATAAATSAAAAIAVGSTNDTIIASRVNDATSTTRAALDKTYSPRRTTNVTTRAAGVVMFSWDDGYPEWDSLVALATSLGQRHTFAVTSDKIDSPTGISSATILAASQAGHEIAAHSKTHTKINSSLAAATRLVEYETPRTAIEAIIGAGKVRTWVWPYGTASSPAGRDSTVDNEIYLRYDRQLDTMGGLLGVSRIGDRPRFNIVRTNWSPEGAGDNTEQIRELIKMAATSPVIVSIYSHNFTTPGTGWTNIQSVLNYAASLGVQCLTASEAFPAEPFYLPDPSFENSVGSPWTPAGAGTGVTHSLSGTSPVGLALNIPGSKVCAVTSANTTSTPYVYIDVPVEAGLSYTVSGRYYLTSATGGAGPKLYVGVQPLDPYSTPVGSSLDSATLHGTVGSWARFSWAVTIPATARTARIKLVLQQLQATVYWDHIHVGPTDYGTYG